MLDIRPDPKPLFFHPPLPSHSLLKDQNGGSGVVDVQRYLEAASIINRISDASARRLPQPIPLRIPALLQQQQQQQLPGGDLSLTSPSLVANATPFDRLPDLPGMMDPAGSLTSNGISGMVRLGTHDRESIPSAFDKLLRVEATSRLNLRHYDHNHHHHHHGHHHNKHHAHHQCHNSAHGPKSLPQSEPSATSSRPSAVVSPSSSSSSGLPSLPLSPNGCSLSPRSSKPRQPHHRRQRHLDDHHHSHHHQQQQHDNHHQQHHQRHRRSSASPELPWRPFQADPEPRHDVTLSKPFRCDQQAFRGTAESLRGEVVGLELADRAFYAALPPLPLQFCPSVPTGMVGDGSLTPGILKFSSLIESATAMGYGIDPLLFPRREFVYHQSSSHSTKAFVPDLKDTFCPASSPRLDLRSSPGKELPTKVKKQNRVKDRQEVTSALEADAVTTEHLLNIKKTASTQTQTQLSSFPNEGLPPPPYHTTHDTIKLDRLNTSIAPLHTPSFPHQHHHHNIPPPPPFSIHAGFHQGTLPPPPPPPPLLPLISSTPQPASSTSVSSSPSPSSPTSSSSSSPSSSSIAPSHKSKILTKAPPLYLERSPPPKYAMVARSPVDVQHAPLNLSLSSQAPPPSSPTTPTHPSVISCGSVAPPVDSSAPDQEGALDRGVPYSHKKFLSSSRAAKDAGQDPISQDEAIEEHFRRSLGQKYAEASSPKQSKKTVQSSQTATFTTASSTPPPPPPPLPPPLALPSSATTTPPSEAEGVSITGSVDDHFARALGNQMWTAIKAKSEPSSPEVSPDAVDAHFAKALGASMWKKIQAKAEDAETDSIQEPQPPPHLQQEKHHKSPSSPSPIHSQVATILFGSV